MDAAEVTIAIIAVFGLLFTLLLLKVGWAPDDHDDPAEWYWDPNSWSVTQKAQFWLWFFAFCPVCLLLLGQKPEGRYRRRTPEEREDYLACQRELEAQDALRRLGEQELAVLVARRDALAQRVEARRNSEEALRLDLARREDRVRRLEALAQEIDDHVASLTQHAIEHEEEQREEP